MGNDKSSTMVLNWILFFLIINTLILVLRNFNLLHQKFQYKIEYFDDQDYNYKLNNLGKQGWKVVGSRRATSSGDYGYELILMK